MKLWRSGKDLNWLSRSSKWLRIGAQERDSTSETSWMRFWRMNNAVTFLRSSRHGSKLRKRFVVRSKLCKREIDDQDVVLS